MGLSSHDSVLGITALFLLQILMAHSLEMNRGIPLFILSMKDLGKSRENATTLYEGVNSFPVRNSSHAAHHQPQFSADSACPYTSRDALDLLTTVENVVNSFYANNAQRITKVDAGFGLGILRGQLSYLLADHNLSPKLKALFSQLHGTSGLLEAQILNQAITALSGDLDPTIRKGMEAIQKNGNVLNGRRQWHDMDAIKNHFNEFQRIGHEKEEFDAMENFKCLTGLVHDCSVPQNCKLAYMGDIKSQYMLTHQVLYQQFAEQRSCATVSPNEFKNAQVYRNRLCSKIYLEAEFLKSNNYPMGYIDLFAEQVGLCGVMGYPNFMRADWLREILSWRDGSASGCMRNMYGEQVTEDIVIPVSDKDGGTEECLVHLSTVSLMAMSMNLRYMVDACEPSLFDDYFAAKSNN